MLLDEKAIIIIRYSVYMKFDGFKFRKKYMDVFLGICLGGAHGCDPRMSLLSACRVSLDARKVKIECTRVPDEWCT